MSDSDNERQTTKILIVAQVHRVKVVIINTSDVVFMCHSSNTCLYLHVVTDTRVPPPYHSSLPPQSCEQIRVTSVRGSEYLQRFARASGSRAPFHINCCLHTACHPYSSALASAVATSRVHLSRSKATLHFFSSLVFVCHATSEVERRVHNVDSFAANAFHRETCASAAH